MNAKAKPAVDELTIPVNNLKQLLYEAVVVLTASLDMVC